MNWEFWNVGRNESPSAPRKYNTIEVVTLSSKDSSASRSLPRQPAMANDCYKCFIEAATTEVSNYCRHQSASLFGHLSNHSALMTLRTRKKIYYCGMI